MRIFFLYCKHKRKIAFEALIGTLLSNFDLLFVSFRFQRSITFFIKPNIFLNLNFDVKFL